MRIAGILMIAGLATPALAADALPLKRGMFVLTEVECKEPYQAAILNFVGDGLNTAHVYGEITRVRRNGQNYVITQKVIGDGGVGGNMRGLHKTTMQIHSPTRFTVQGPGAGTYRYCGPA